MCVSEVKLYFSMPFEVLAYLGSKISFQFVNPDRHLKIIFFVNGFTPTYQCVLLQFTHTQCSLPSDV